MFEDEIEMYQIQLYLSITNNIERFLSYPC